MLNKEEEAKQVQKVKACGNAYQISHLFYTNDLLLFFKADSESCELMGFLICGVTYPICQRISYLYMAHKKLYIVLNLFVQHYGK